MTYEEFLNQKRDFGENHGFIPIGLPDFLFDFQKSLVDWALRKGRSAIFADCGLGKTPISLTWADNVARKTNGRVLILTPLAVAPQFVIDAEKFGLECVQSKDGTLKGNVIVTNYDRLHYFNSSDFTGVICDESAILKNFKGKTKAAITEFIRKLPYRLLCTATPAPNDFIELGTSSEALGELGYIDMLKMFFKSDSGTYAQGGSGGNRRYDKNAFGGKFRLRGHAERDFWRWVCSWARAIRKPSDLGFSDDQFTLPSLTTRQHVVASESRREGWLFSVPAHGRKEELSERRATLRERCERAAQLVCEHSGQSIAWCHLNPEGDLLEKLIPNSVQVSGSDRIEEKEEAIDAFRTGQVQNLISKPDICGHGLNLQNCAHQTFFPSHSFEQWYQAIRRSWRFGQKNPVTIDVVTSQGESRVLANLERKSEAAEKMFSRLVALMNEELSVSKATYTPRQTIIPEFILC